MSNLARDIYQYQDDLKEAGVEDRLAEAQAKALAKVLDGHVASKHDLEKLELATKHDIAMLRKDIASDFNGLRKDMDANVATLRKDMDANVTTLRKDMDTRFSEFGKTVEIMLNRKIFAAAGLIIAAVTGFHFFPV